jgi:hypothetical protein
MLLLIFLHTGKKNTSIKDFLFSKLSHGDILDKSRTTSFSDELKE